MTNPSSVSRRGWLSASALTLLGCGTATSAAEAENPSLGASANPATAAPQNEDDRRGLALVGDRIDDYCSAHTVAESPAMQAIARETVETTEMWIMMIGPVEGALLRMLVQLSRARRIIEVGTFTGYSAIAMAEGLPDDGELITCDISEEWTAIARRHWQTSPHGSKIDLRLAPAAETLASLDGPFDFAFIDADKAAYPDYWDAIVPKLSPGGIIVCDNVLAGGRVAASGESQARTMAAFNDKVAQDARVESLMLPLRDGVSISRKRLQSSRGSG